jgi:succinate dehydrogenase/fumarate reductase flavoprotein subunit
MSRDVAVVRDAAGLARARAEIDDVASTLATNSGQHDLDVDPAARRTYWELRNLVNAARAVIESASHREESRGAHYRADFPETDPALDGAHTLRDGAGNLQFGALAEAFAPDHVLG